MAGFLANESAGLFFDALSSTGVSMVSSREDDLSPTNVVENLRAFVRGWSQEGPVALEPWGELLVTLVLLTYEMRPTTVSPWEEVEIVYAVVGDRRWRAHDGYLFSYKNGGWEKLSGPTPSIVLKEVSAALVTLEGFYLCCGKHTGVGTARQQDSLLRRARELLSGNGPRDFADKTVVEEGHFLRNHKGPGRTPVDGGVCDWAERQAEFVATFRKRLIDELSADLFRRAYVEWTDAPYRPAGPAIAFDDSYFGPSLVSEGKKPDNNSYVQLNYGAILPDPVMEKAYGRLRRFLHSCYYDNFPALKLYLALEALAAHYVNTKITLFFQDDGGRGKSALSLLRATVWEKLHTFADPSIFFAEEELRKQGVNLCHMLFVTIQEALENGRTAFLDHLWKKFCTQEKVAIRPNYAKQTRMVSFSGLKVWELNRVMRAAGCTYDCIRRRLICFHLKCHLTPDAQSVDEGNGVFLIDHKIGDFLASGPCAAAYMTRIFLPFLRRTTQAECCAMVADLEAFDAQHGSTISSDSDKLAAEMCSEGVKAPHVLSDLCTQPASDRHGEHWEGAAARDKLLTGRDKVFVSRVHLCAQIPGTVRTPKKKRGRDGEIIASRKATMEGYVALGLFRKEGSEYVPVIPTTATFSPHPAAGAEDGYVELPDVERMRNLASDGIVWSNLEKLQKLWSELRGDRHAVGTSLGESDITQHIAALGRLAHVRDSYVRQLGAAGGELSVQYSYKSPIGGRRYAAQPFASQNLPRHIREEAFSNTTLEIDMVNAFPTLLGKLVVKICGTKYAQKMVPGLLEYNSRRNEILEEISLWAGGSRSQAKELVLRLLNGGAIDSFFRTPKKTQLGNKPLLHLPAHEAPQILHSVIKSGIFCGRLARQIAPELAAHYRNRDHPEQTALHYIAASLEDRVLAEAEILR